MYATYGFSGFYAQPLKFSFLNCHDSGMNSLVYFLVLSKLDMSLVCPICVKQVLCKCDF